MTNYEPENLTRKTRTYAFLRNELYSVDAFPIATNLSVIVVADGGLAASRREVFVVILSSASVDWWTDVGSLPNVEDLLGRTSHTCMQCCVYSS